MTEERNTAAPETEESRNFILNLIDQDIAEGGQFQGQTVHTRFPPEPNGYLHIGHCKALCIDFGTAEKFGGLCNLRMDDTNPAKEDTEYVDAIQQDIHWLGFDWGDRFFYGSDDALRLVPPRRLSLEQCLEFLADDELLEVTPENLRIRKTILNHEKRMKASHGGKKK